MMVALTVVIVLLLTKAVLTVTIAVAHRSRIRRQHRELPATPLGVTVMIAAYNEEIGIGGTLTSVLSEPLEELQVVVVDDGSSDGTAAAVERFAQLDPRVQLIRQENTGKAGALNHALKYVRYPVAVSVDADSAISPGTLAALARHFHDPRVGAVAGDVRVAGEAKLLTHMQDMEYTIGQHMEKRAQCFLGTVSVVPGAAGAYRTELLRELGGYSHDTLTEDMDLTIAVAAAGYRVRFEPLALSFTEPPQMLKHLWRQRLRWMYGTFQVMGKYRHLIFNPRAGRLGLLTLPYVLLYGLVLGGLSPLIEILAITILVQYTVVENLWPILMQILAEVVVIGAALALGGASWRMLLYTPTQRFFLRPFVSIVVLMTCWTFLRRRNVHWNKLPRVGLNMAMTNPASRTPAAAPVPVPATVPLPMPISGSTEERAS
ncbi:glycosyltransferase [Deinococcus deserti]|uniref:Putative glycosyltransferase n=1 Tax=Deinococcus deserti (strain DSM 17065 / CIP 109153 / LMG 22923 / VCD115) TaxID=546414 RepID=C1D0J4_DEIDV|nr:glycosyltransferase [Deinococcus deserti]ACO45368.1 putative glycosyltransferase [Deinococcus deserti VCD115]